MASLALSIAGAAVGSLFGAPQLGWMIGSAIGSSLVKPPTVTQEGARLSDLRVQSSAQGQPIPRLYGTMRVPGNMIWSLPIRETRHTSSQTVGSKGGGGGGQKVESVSYTYSQSFAIGICEGPILGIRKIWANGELIYNIADTASARTYSASNGFFGGLLGDVVGQVISAQSTLGFTLYLGSEDQTPNTLIQADKGVANTPAFRGLAYIVFNDLQLAKFGNRTPNLEFEVVSDGIYPAADPWNTWAAALPPTYDRFQYVYLCATPSAVYALARNGSLYKSTGGDFVYLRTLDVTDPGMANMFVHNGELRCGAHIYDPGTSSYGLKMIVIGDASDTITALPTIEGAYDLRGMYYSYKGVIGMLGGTNGSGSPRSTFYYSTDDGATYNVGTAPAWSCDKTTYCEHKGYLYAFGDGNFSRGVARTADGINWQLVTTTPGYGQNLAAQLYAASAWSVNNVLYLTVAGGLWQSTDDGVTWSPVAFTSPTSSSLAALSDCAAVIWHDLIFLAHQRSGFSNPANPLNDILVTRAAYFGTENGLGGAPLGDVVADICNSCGMTSGQYDVASLTDLVPGFMTTRATGRAKIEPLQQVFYFDAVESGGQLKFVKRGGAVVVNIPESETAAHAYGGEMPDNLQTVWQQESELPHEVSVNYFEMESAYAVGNQYARRLTGNAQQTLTIDLKMALSAAKARQVAEVLLWDAWMSRATFTQPVSRKYTYVEPTDVITVNKGNATHTVRIVDKNEAGGIINLSLARDNASSYTQAPPAVSQNAPTQELTPTPATDAYLLDIPLLRDVDNGVGFYGAFAPHQDPSAWDGTRLYRSTDGGTTYDTYGAATALASVVGTASNTLGDFHGGNVFDELNTLTVVINDGGELTSLSEALVLSGLNAALIGNEIIQFKNAELVATNTYTLSGLLRGRRGTEWAIGAHGADEDFVALSATALLRIDEDSSQIGLSRKFKAPTLGTLLTDATAFDFTNTGESLRPYAPVQVGGGRDDTAAVIINWVRRARTGGEWRDGVDVGLDEASEAYEVEIYDTGFSTLKRTITGLSSPTTTYSAADQTTDFGSPQASIGVRVYQLSARVGRGHAASATV